MKQKRWLTALLAAALTLSSTCAFAAAERIILDGTAADIPADMGSIRELDERTFVPIRFVMEHLGCHVDYDDSTKMAIVSSETCSYIIQADNPILYTIPYADVQASGETVNLAMDTAPFIDDAESRMYIPIRFLAQAIGYEVGWDETTQTVTLTMAAE